MWHLQTPADLVWNFQLNWSEKPELLLLNFLSYIQRFNFQTLVVHDTMKQYHSTATCESQYTVSQEVTACNLMSNLLTPGDLGTSARVTPIV